MVVVHPGRCPGLPYCAPIGAENRSRMATAFRRTVILGNSSQHPAIIHSQFCRRQTSILRPPQRHRDLVLLVQMRMGLAALRRLGELAADLLERVDRLLLVTCLFV